MKWPNDIECKRCGCQHRFIQLDVQTGVPQLPELVTTIRDFERKWIFVCKGTCEAAHG